MRTMFLILALVFLAACLCVGLFSFSSTFFYYQFATSQDVPPVVRTAVYDWVLGTPQVLEDYPITGGSYARAVLGFKGYKGPVGFSCEMPVKGHTYVTDVFGSDRGRYRHGGIDYGTDGQNGRQVVTVMSGMVVAAGDCGPYGICALVENYNPQDGKWYQTLYGHLESLSVSRGQVVVAGQEIGRSDNTGNSTGPHLHFEMRRCEKGQDDKVHCFAVDPLSTMLPGQSIFCDWYLLPKIGHTP